MSNSSLQDCTPVQEGQTRVDNLGQSVRVVKVGPAWGACTIQYPNQIMCVYLAATIEMVYPTVQS